jgi:hypothetical protein
MRSCVDGPSSERQIPDMVTLVTSSTNGMRICATKVSGGDCGDTSGFRTLLHGPHNPDSDLMGQGTAIGTVLRGDISKLRRCRKTLRRGRKGYQRLIPLDICCHFSEALTFP